MKKFITVAITLFVAIIAAQSVMAATGTTTTTTTITVIRLDNGVGIPTWCPFSGTGCTVTVTTVTQSCDIAQITGGYVLTLAALPMTTTVIRSGSPVESTCTNNSIVFPSGAAFIINSCPTFPSLVNEIVSVSGVATDSYGGFSVLFTP